MSQFVGMGGERLRVGGSEEDDREAGGPCRALRAGPGGGDQQAHLGHSK